MINPDSTLPTISCIMPTMPHRKAFVAQAIRLFNAQDYPNTELIIIDDGEFDSVGCVVPAQENIEYVYIDTMGTYAHLSIGAKRNLACSLAKGDILCQWDDDDWFGPQRLSRQVQPILDGDADVTALRMDLLLDARDGTLWHCSDEVHQSLFPFDVRCGSLMYKASYWHEGWSYGNEKGEDVRFFHGLLRSGARLRQIRAPQEYVCVRHGGNTSEDIDGMDSPGWERVPMEQYFHGDDLLFYQGLKEAGVR